MSRLPNISHGITFKLVSVWPAKSRMLGSFKLVSVWPVRSRMLRLKLESPIWKMGDIKLVISLVMGKGLQNEMVNACFVRIGY